MSRAVVFLLLSSLFAASALCPSECSCFLDDRGRQKISCDAGGMVGPLDVTKMDAGIEVLHISAPDDNLNSLIIGPIFGSFKQLEELHITHSNIPEIGIYSFYGLVSLEVLNLRTNNISTILHQNFVGLKKLQKLYLDDNRIEHLTSGSFKDLTNLKTLSLARNHLKVMVTRVFEKLSKLQELNIGGNNLKELNPDIFVDIKELKILECRHCALKLMDPEIFETILELTTLDLGDNELSSIDDLSALTNLTSLWLDGNRIHYIGSGAFSSQTELKKLNLANNNLVQIQEGAFQNLTNLMDLNLSRNKITELGLATIEPFSESLQYLDISSTGLSTENLQYLLPHLRRLKHLGLANLGLSDLPIGLFDFNLELLSLNLAKNYFIYLPVGVLSPVAHLKTLDFSKNRLRGLDDKSLQRLEVVDVVNIEENPWSCDLCHIVHMLEAMNKTFYLQDIVCEGPYNLRGRKMNSLEISDLRKCSNNDLYYDTNDFNFVHNYFISEGRLGIIAVGAGLLLLLLTIFALLAGVCYSKRHAANYYTHEDKRNVEEDPMFDQHDLLFGESGELNFKFPLDKKISIATIDEIKKDPDIQSMKNVT